MNDRSDASDASRPQLTELVERITSLADGIETRLDNERIDRQIIAEDAITGLRELARLYGGER